MRLIKVTHHEVKQGRAVRQRMAEEEMIWEKVDENGNRWTKVYFDSGAHFRNGFTQFSELKGEKNVKVEEADSRGFQCYEESGENMYRIRVKDMDVGE